MKILLLAIGLVVVVGLGAWSMALWVHTKLWLRMMPVIPHPADPQFWAKIERHRRYMATTGGFPMSVLTREGWQALDPSRYPLLPDRRDMVTMAPSATIRYDA